MRSPSRCIDREDGFTLVELLVVIVILGILIAIAVPSFLGQTGKADDAAAKTSLSTAYANAKADQPDNNGKFSDAATIADELTSDEPELGDVQTIDHSSAISAEGALYIVDTATPGISGQDFEAAIKSKSGNICTVTVVGNGAPDFECPGTDIDGDGAPIADAGGTGSTASTTEDSLAAMAVTDSFQESPAGVAFGTSIDQVTSNWSLANFVNAGSDATMGVLKNTSLGLGYAGMDDSGHTQTNAGWTGTYWNQQQFDGSGAGGDADQFTFERVPTAGSTVELWLNMPSPPQKVSSSSSTTGWAGSYTGYNLRISSPGTGNGPWTFYLSKFVNGVGTGSTTGSEYVAKATVANLTSKATDGAGSSIALVYKGGTISVEIGTDGANFNPVPGLSWHDTGTPLTSGWAGISAGSYSFNLINFKAAQLGG